MSGIEIIEHLRALPPGERRQVVARIWREFADRDLELTEKEATELDSRVAEHAALPDAVITWEEIKTANEARHRKKP